jgi:hypothetical protein
MEAVYTIDLKAVYTIRAYGGRIETVSRPYGGHIEAGANLPISV